MTELVNQDCGRSLLEVIHDAALATTGRRGKRTLVALTCYVDRDAVDALVAKVREALAEQDARLTGFRLFVDPGEWVKQRIDGAKARRRFAQTGGLRLRDVQVGPAWFPGQLFHAKCYALLGPRRDQGRRGCVVMTSGNLTRRGLGLESGGNIEFAHVLKGPKALREVAEIEQLLTDEHALSDAREQAHAELLLALRLFALGDFYHQWKSPLANATRFTLILTAKGRRKLRGANTYPGYVPRAKTISRDPLQLGALFGNVGDVFPKNFWRDNSIDTVLGRWVPTGVATAIDEAMQDKLKPYRDKFRAATSRRQLDTLTEVLEREVAEFEGDGYIEADETLVKRWRQRVVELRTDSDALRLHVMRYERLPDPLDVANRSLIIKTIDSVRDRVGTARHPRGLKRLLADFLELDGQPDDADWVALRKGLREVAHKAAGKLHRDSM